MKNILLSTFILLAIVATRSVADDVKILAGNAVFIEPEQSLVLIKGNPVKLAKNTVLYDEMEFTSSEVIKLKGDFIYKHTSGTTEIKNDRAISAWTGPNGKSYCHTKFGKPAIVSCFEDTNIDYSFETMAVLIQGSEPFRVTLPSPIPYEFAQIPESASSRSYSYTRFGYHRRVAVKKLSKKSITLMIEVAQLNWEEKPLKYNRRSKSDKKISIKKLPMTVSMEGLQVQLSKNGDGAIIANVSGGMNKSLFLGGLDKSLNTFGGSYNISHSIVQ